jgi:hypothetical protein
MRSTIILAGLEMRPSPMRCEMVLPGMLTMLYIPDGPAHRGHF